jgi:hypothetical protein
LSSSFAHSAVCSALPLWSHGRYRAHNLAGRGRSRHAGQSRTNKHIAECQGRVEFIGAALLWPPSSCAGPLPTASHCPATVHSTWAGSRPSDTGSARTAGSGPFLHNFCPSHPAQERQERPRERPPRPPALQTTVPHVEQADGPRGEQSQFLTATLNRSCLTSRLMGTAVETLQGYSRRNTKDAARITAVHH